MDMVSLAAVLGIGIAFDGCCLGVLLGYLVPADPAMLPRIVAWLQDDKDPRPDSSIPPRPYRWAMRVMAVIILVYTQGAMVANLVLAPTWTSEIFSGPTVGYILFVGVEALLLAWTVFVYWAFRRAAN